MDIFKIQNKIIYRQKSFMNSNFITIIYKKLHDHANSSNGNCTDVCTYHCIIIILEVY